MIEKQVDLWFAATTADAVCVTTNGSLADRGRRGVMGRGCAKEAVEIWGEQGVHLERRLGMYLARFGNHTGVLMPPPPYTLVVFPVKHVWDEPATLELIARSAYELGTLADGMGWQQVVLPRPGCGNGGLTWDVVKPIIAPMLLGDRFVVVHK
jgi:hypothetical protein